MAQRSVKAKRSPRAPHAGRPAEPRGLSPTKKATSRPRPADKVAQSSREASAAFMHAHGIHVSLDGLERMIAQAVGRLQKTMYPVDSSRELTSPERDALERGGFDLTPGPLAENDPLAQTTAEYAALLKTSKTVAEIAAILDVNESRIRQRLNAEPPTLYGFKLEGEWRIPSFLIEKRSLVPGVGKLASKVDRNVHPVALYRWFTSPNPDLVEEKVTGGEPLSPRRWLLSGLLPDTVAELAAEL